MNNLCYFYETRRSNGALTLYPTICFKSLSSSEALIQVALRMQDIALIEIIHFTTGKSPPPE